MTILVITTGGTIGAMPVKNPQHQPHIKTMPGDKRDMVREALSSPAFRSLQIRCVALEHRDSNSIDEPYRTEMAGLIEAAPETKVLITHGTDTLLETADFLYQRSRTGAGMKGKTVIVTGAMVPLANGEQSDGYLNLAFSLARLSPAGGEPPGVYMVLCNFDFPETEQGAWKPRLYPYAPGRYKRYYSADDRYSRIVSLPP